MAKRRSIVGVAKREQSADAKLRKGIAKVRDDYRHGKIPTGDSFVNFAHKLGIGADNPLSTASYGFNPISRQRTILEWIHRGSWIGGVAVDLVADDMTRMGIELQTDLEPEALEEIDEAAVTLNIWNQINDTIKWSRLYGGSLGVMMIEGQDPSTPLRLETVGKNTPFRGLLVLDRWMVEPSLNQLVTKMGPDMGNPVFYNVTADAPALPKMKVHHTRCLRLEGIRLPYWQRVMENLWGISVLERLYDRMVAFDSATTGAAQLVYKSYIRTYAVEELREVIAAGGPPLDALTRYVDMMRRFAGIEGMTLIDAKDKMEAMQTTSFSGLSDALIQFGQQLSGALQIPLVRLFGQSPAGLNATGESDLRTYYDHIKQKQETDLRVPVTRIYRAIGQSEGIILPEGMKMFFNSLWQLTDKEKADIAEVGERTIADAEEKGLISQKGAMKELQKLSHTTGFFTSITDEDIEAAEESLPPAGEEAANLALEASSSSSGEEGEEGGPKPAGGQPAKKAKDSISAVSNMKKFHNLDVVIENPRGSIRRGVGWEQVMPYDYGYVRRTIAPDGDEVDCCIGPHHDSPYVWVIHQVNLEDRSPDEPKVMLGYRDTHAALSAYVSGYGDGKGLDRIGSMDSMNVEKFRDVWLAQFKGAK